MTASSEPASPPTPSTETGPVLNRWLLTALGVAVVGLAGSIFVSLGMGLKACPLCFYQRTFMMSLVAVLGGGLVSGLGRSGRLGLLALPLAVAGLGVAGFHVYLEAAGKLECPQGPFGLGTVPVQSLLTFVVLTALLLADVVQGRLLRGPLLVGGVGFGALLALFSCISNPPLPGPPDKPYAAAPDVCRAPYSPR